MANDAVNSACHEFMIRLDGDEAAEAPPEDENRGQPEGAAEREQRDTEPAHALFAERQNVVLVGVGG